MMSVVVNWLGSYPWREIQICASRVIDANCFFASTITTSDCTSST